MGRGNKQTCRAWVWHFAQGGCVGFRITPGHSGQRYKDTSHAADAGGGFATSSGALLHACCFVSYSAVLEKEIHLHVMLFLLYVGCGIDGRSKRSDTAAKCVLCGDYTALVSVVWAQLAWVRYSTASNVMFFTIIHAMSPKSSQQRHATSSSTGCARRPDFPSFREKSGSV